MAEHSAPKGPDFTQGVALSDIPSQGALGGRVGDDPVLLLRRDDGLFALSGRCTHYGGPLAEGLIERDSVRCPWHHACFDLRTGEALRAPAFDPLDRWKVEVEDDRAFVREKLAAAPARKQPGSHPERIVIVGGGAAGFSAAEMLRRRGYEGALTMLSADPAPPVDRPNLSKDYLAGTAPEDWMPLKPPAFYAENRIDLRTGLEVSAIATGAREVIAAGGERFAYDALLRATGSEPIRLPGFDHPRVHTLRSFADSRAIIAAAETARTAVVVGASFIGLEVAASLRHRGIEVHVAAPDEIPMEKVLGRELGLLVKRTHEARGVSFHLGQNATGFDGEAVILADRTRLAADLVVLGVGVRPRTGLAEMAGLKVDKGVIVDDRLRTSIDGVFAAGDIARYPDPITAEAIRVEHWVHACRQGQTAAVNMLGGDQAYDEAPFFWSNHYDLVIHYVGHASRIDAVVVDGSVADRDATVGFLQGERRLAAASVGRDLQNLEIERELEGLG
jgi:NADPH-dependent 2,4-dienoyl-CoA reductase/sulfur reductase-like enzyme/nitrite reductase/ring-hydroxylating ferredoxin subunit